MNYVKNISCTKDHPWDGKKLEDGARVEHAAAAETDKERDFGDGCYCVQMECPNCKHKWWKELPQ